MFIQTEQTPNPATIKFIPGCEVMTHGTAEFADKSGAAASPMATRLFALPGVAKVFLGRDFIAVTRDEAADWRELKARVLGAIMDHFTAGLPVMDGEAEASAPAPCENDSEAVRKIKELLETHIRPAVAQDGGDVTFHDFADGVVYLHMRGACAGCPSATMTLKMGIERLLKHYVPEITEVRAAA